MEFTMSLENHAMIDWETLDTAPSAIVLSVGIAIFNIEGVVAKFYANIDIDSLDSSHTVSSSTLEWWNKPKQAEAKRMLSINRQPIKVVVAEMVKFLETYETKYLWGNGASFDIPIYDNVLSKCKIQNPVSFWNYRCHRTLKNLYPIVNTMVRSGTAHNALDDAIYQANQCIEALKLHRINSSK